MDLRQLRHFAAVADALHFTRAAERAGIEQSPLSRSIRNLEQSIGVPLLERDRRSVRLTPAGERLLGYAKSILAAADEARIETRALAGERNEHLRIGVCDGVPLPRLARLLAALRSETPAIHVQVFYSSMSQKLHDLRQGFLDAALAPESGYGKGIAAHAIWEDPPVALLPSDHSLSTKKSLDLGELVSEPLILCRPDTGLGQQSQVELLVRAVSPTPNIVDRATTICMLMMLVAAGYGIGIATAPLLEAIDGHTLAVRPLLQTSPGVKTWLILREGAQDDALARFIERARQIM